MDALLAALPQQPSPSRRSLGAVIAVIGICTYSQIPGEADAQTDLGALLEERGEKPENFGSSVAISGDRIVVTTGNKLAEATIVDEPATTIEEPAAYVFVRSGDGWLFESALRIQVGEGWRVFLAQDGFEVTGAAIHGTEVFIGVKGLSIDEIPVVLRFRAASAETWIQEDPLTVTEARFSSGLGWGEALVAQQDSVFVGARASGGTTLNEVQWLRRDQDGLWKRQSPIGPTAALGGQVNFGHVLAVDSDTLLVGAAPKSGLLEPGVSEPSISELGRVYVVDLRNGESRQIAEGRPNQGKQVLGHAVAVAGDWGAAREGDEVRMFKRVDSKDGGWEETSTVRARNGCFSGEGRALAMAKNTLVVGSSGGSCIHYRAGETWLPLDAVVVPVGSALSLNGKTLVAGSMDRSEVNVYELSGLEGAPCASDADCVDSTFYGCGANHTCQHRIFNRGLCTGPWGPGETGPCPHTPCMGDRCLTGCTDSAECRNGYRCGRRGACEQR